MKSLRISDNKITGNAVQSRGVELYNVVKCQVTKNDFHCNASGDIFDLGTDTKFINNSTGPLRECQ